MRITRANNPGGRSRAVRGAAIAAALFSGAATPLVSAADNAADSAWSLRGFGTLGAVHSNVKDADFVSGFFEPNGAGHTRRTAFGVDSKIGLQADLRISDKLTAVLQVVSQHSYDNSYDPRVEWANAKYQITPDFDVRLGRTVTMPFMVSDSRLVGYGNLWIRPPQEVYGLIPLTNKNGIDATYRLHIGDVTNSIHASYGQAHPKLPASGRVKAKRYIDVSNTIEYGPTTLRASYSTARVDLHTTSLNALVDGLAQFGNTLSAIPGFAVPGAQALDLANRYRFEDAPISVIALGAGYDRGSWLIMTEWAKFNGHSILADSTAAYATVAYRIGKFTPYITAAKLKADHRSESGISTLGMPLPLAATALALNGGVNAAVTGARFAQQSFSIGLRWDFMKSAALKAQYDHLNLDSGSSGRLGNVQPNFQPGGSANVFSLALDFVF